MNLEKIEEFRAQVEKKIRHLIEEFSSGEISPAQFNAVYERYSGQLMLANIALESGDAQALNAALQGPPTLAVKEKYMGKALGMRIYVHHADSAIKTLGMFNVDDERLEAALEMFWEQTENNALTDDHMLEQLGDGRWLLVTNDHWSYVATLFRNEPSGMQINEMHRLHNDFELANEANLVSDEVDADELAYPFLVFTQRSM